MVDSEKKDFAEAIGAMCAAFGTDASKALILGYWMGLSDLALSDVQMAVARSMRECEHLPRPVELRRLAGERTAESSAIAAWADVQKAIPLGPYKHLDFSDKLINATIRNFGGWPTFMSRLSDSETEKWLRIEFLKCYSAFASSGVNGEACEPLAGISQASVVDGEIVAPLVVRIECTSRAIPRLAQSKHQPLLRLKEAANV